MSGEQILYNRPLPGARLNMAHPLARGLGGCWLLNENGGLRAMDLSPYANHGLLIGFTNPPPRPFNGLVFDGTDDYVDVGNSLNLNFTSEDFTIEAWLKYSSAGSGDMQIFIRGEEGVEGYQLFVSFATKNPVFRVAQSGANQGSTGDADTLTADVWHLLVAARSGALATLYVDGSSIPQTQQTLTNPTTSVKTAKIGRYESSARFFFGPIGAVLIHNRFLSAEDVKALYISPYRPMGLPLFF